MAGRVAKEGDRLILVACCEAGPVYTLAAGRDERRCPSCRGRGEDVEEIVLEAGGALPGSDPRPTWREIVAADCIQEDEGGGPDDAEAGAGQSPRSSDGPVDVVSVDASGPAGMEVPT